MQKFSKENLRIKTFKLALIRDTELLLGCKVDEWLEIAVRNQVAEIELQGPVNYKLPRFLFCAKSLTHLDCDNVEIPYYEALDLVSLESLVLRHNVVIEERMLFHIVSSCLNLKDLCISFCSGFKNLVIPRHSKLEYLYIEGDVPVDGGKVILETSSLATFDCNINGKNDPWPIISNRGLLRNLRHLFVTRLPITGEDLAKLVPELTSLEKLMFIGCDMLTSIQIPHPQLKQICFYECDNNLLNVVIDAPNLNKFKFRGKIRPPLSITIHSQASCTINIRTKARYLDTDGFFKLKKLLKGLNSCNVLKIFLSGRHNIKFDEKKSGNAELGPPCDIGELVLNMSRWKLSSSSLSAFLNGLFWTCHPPIISLRIYPYLYALIVEPLVNNLVEMVKCLEHPLKRIEVEETNNDSDFLHVQLRLCW
ncbi:uncharacterized protein LOC141608762 [Silene latifolia]|uniref:uncharacterized protein LOC141608762 n=1 Tax=Silene latifolia TaxID=37657 RepID=UPI003D787FB4